MMLALLAAAAAAVAAPDPSIAEAKHAVESGRLDQARLMIGNAVERGVAGPELDRLLADLAFASGDNQSALARYDQLLKASPADAAMLERAGVAALRLGHAARAKQLLDRAVATGKASWQGWNGLGVIADRTGDWPAADRAYAKASQLAPRRAEPANNLGYSLMLRGRWGEALPVLEHAASLDPKSPRIAHNLELARMAIAKDLPQRRPGESDSDWAARLNDAGVVARLQGDNKRAVAAFARAIEARKTWFERAANNLALTEGRK